MALPRDDERQDGRGSPQEAQAARDALRWVLGRLTVLEYLILFLAMLLALLGGALVAWVLDAVVSISFRWLWAGASLLLFILPGGFVYLREFRKGRKPTERNATTEPEEHHG
jgi:hypothetical protein